MPNLEVKSSVHISIPSKLLETFNALSIENGKSRNQILIELIQEWIEDQEDIKIAEQVIKDIKEGKTSTISWEEMKQKLG